MGLEWKPFYFCREMHSALVVRSGNKLLVLLVLLASAICICAESFLIITAQYSYSVIYVCTIVHTLYRTDYPKKMLDGFGFRV